MPPTPPRRPPSTSPATDRDTAGRLLDNARFREVVDSITDYAIFLLTPDGRVASWNTGAQRLKGWSEDEIVGRHFSTFYPPEQVESGWPDEELRRAAAAGRFEDEGWRVRKDGSRFWANVIISAVRDDDGQLVGFSKVTRDVTERRQHEVRLRESERSLRLLIEGVQDYAIFRLDPQGIITSWNQGAERIKGWTAAEIIGRHFSIFYPPQAIARGWPDEELRRAAELGRFEDEGWRVRKDGTRLWANVVITAIRDETGELIGYSKVTRDLTQRRMHEQRLRESEENLRLVVDGVRDHAMFLLDAEGMVASWNSGAQRVLGHAADEILGRPVARLYSDEEREAGRPQAELLSARHAGFFESDGWRLRADGTPLYVHVTLTALRSASGELRGFVQILRDLSERLRVRQLETEGERIHSFIAMLSHELRNPLAPITNAVRVLKRHQGDADVRWCADLIGRQSAHLSRLVDDLLDVSRITRGKVRLQPRPLQLDAIVRQAVDSHRGAATTAGQSLTLSLPTGPVAVEGDPTRLHQVIANLLSNATKYTPDGGRIDVAVSRDGPVATLQVTDSGIGMSDALMQHAFEPFVQGNRTLDRREGGLGVGLTLVKSVVEMHGGRVAVASAGTDRGTRFTVTLPLLREPAMAGDAGGASPGAGAGAASRSADATPTVAPAPRRVLIVDDNHDAADSLGELLRLYGHEVQLAHEGLTALRLAREQVPDLVLLDLGLPGMDGFEVARRLRAMPDTARTRLVALTGYGQPSDREATAAAGFDEHLVKPVELDQLLPVIEAADVASASGH